MEKISLYRKYRPKTLKNIIGQDLIKEAILRSNQNNSISNAYIFSGPRGVGKTSIAKILAAAINCENKEDGDCCLKCKNCTQITNNKAIDIIELDAASNNGVEQMRDIIESVNYFPNSLKYKVYIIDEAHMLSNSAWNAMLKTIEEPPLHCVFIFATTEYNKIPLTIISRCQRFDFSRLNKNEIKKLLDKVIEQEKIIIDKEAIEKIIELSDGSGRDSLSILGQMLNYDKITVEVINKVFGLSSNENKVKFIKSILNKSYLDLKEKIDTMYDNGLDLEIFLNENIDMLIEILVYKNTSDLNSVKRINQNELEQFVEDERELLDLFNELVDLSQKIKKTKYKKLELDIFITGLLNRKKTDLTKEEKIYNFEKKIEDDESKNISKLKKIKEEPEVLEQDVLNKHEPFTLNELKWSSDLKIIHHKKAPENKVELNKESIQKNQKQAKEIDIDNQFKVYDPNEFKEKLIQIAFWTKQNNIKEDRELLNSYLSNNIVKNKKNGEILNIFDVSKLFASSKNGIIVSSEFSNQILKLNQINETKDFVNVVREIFKRPILVLGVNLKQEKEIKEHIKQNKEQLKKDIIKDVDIKGILKVINEIEEDNKKTLEALSKLEIED